MDLETAVSGDVIGPPGARSSSPLAEPPGKTPPDWSPNRPTIALPTRVSAYNRSEPFGPSRRGPIRQKDNRRVEDQSEGWTRDRGPIRRSIDGSKVGREPIKRTTGGMSTNQKPLQRSPIRMSGGARTNQRVCSPSTSRSDGGTTCDIHNSPVWFLVFSDRRVTRPIPLDRYSRFRKFLGVFPEFSGHPWGAPIPPPPTY